MAHRDRTLSVADLAIYDLEHAPHEETVGAMSATTSKSSLPVLDVCAGSVQQGTGRRSLSRQSSAELAPHHAVAIDHTQLATTLTALVERPAFPEEESVASPSSSSTSESAPVTVRTPLIGRRVSIKEGATQIRRNNEPRVLLKSTYRESAKSAVLYHNGRPRNMTLNTEGLVVTDASHEAGSWLRSCTRRAPPMHIKITEIFACVAVADGKAEARGKFAFEIHTFRRAKATIWKPVTLVFKCHSVHVQQQWIAALTALIREQERPQRLLVIINPFSGRKQGHKVFERTKHLFELAGVQLDTVTTERASHATEIVLNYNLATIDGVVVYGGDGTLNEVIAGFFSRSDRRTVPVGIIPSGSTDTVACSIQGTRDTVTAILHVIFGDRHALDIGDIDATENHDRRYFSNMVTFGFFADTVQCSEKMRILGPMRYDIAGAITFLRHSPVEMEMQFVRAHAHQTHQVCRSGCSFCRRPGDATPVAHMPPERWETMSGEYQSVSLAALSLINDKSVRGFVPDAHLADGIAHLVLVHKCSRFNYLRFLIRVANFGNQFDLPFVERIPVSAVRFHPVGPSRDGRAWAVDGELHAPLNVSAKAAARSLMMFSRGIEE